VYWDVFIELVRALILTVAGAIGGNVGGAIALVSFLLRLALIPLQLKVTRRVQAQRKKIAELKPQLERLQKRFAKDPRARGLATIELYKANGVRMLDPLMWLSIGVQWPLFAGLYGAVRAGLGAGKRFLWIADLSKPDALLAFVAAALVAISVKLAATSGSAEAVSSAQAATMVRVQMVIAAVSTLAMLLGSGAVMGLSVVGGTVGVVLQEWVKLGLAASRARSHAK
jgi:YidC/Oxa1 family membrane protein insertase